MKLSVVITTYNRPKLLVRAVNSVIAARTSDIMIDIIVVDDASTTLPPEFNHDNITYYRLPVNRGHCLAKMQGLALAKTQWVLVMDDDDVLVKSSLPLLAEILKRSDMADYPVIQCATSNGKLKHAYLLLDFNSYLSKEIEGDFTAVFNRQRFLQTGLSFPDNRAGGEHIVWWQLADDYGIPTYQFILVTIGDDAPVRLTSCTSQIKRAADHQALAELTLAKFGERLRVSYPQEYQRRHLARVTYSLLSQKRKQARHYLQKSPFKWYLKTAFWLVSWLPLFCLQRAFTGYRWLQQKRV
ncbi:MAG: glycosyltransferase family 2 protein [Candidatus Symbiodolus clandestinus]